MTASEYLADQDFPVSALRVAGAIGQSIEDTYAELVALESAGVAQVVVEWVDPDGRELSMPARTWAAVEQEIA